MLLRDHGASSNLTPAGVGFATRGGRGGIPTFAGLSDGVSASWGCDGVDSIVGFLQFSGNSCGNS